MAPLQRFDGLGAVGDRVGLVSQFLQLRQSHVPVGGIVLRHQDSSAPFRRMRRIPGA